VLAKDPTAGPREDSVRGSRGDKPEVAIAIFQRVESAAIWSADVADRSHDGERSALTPQLSGNRDAL
jgi:hypothetical protein